MKRVALIVGAGAVENAWTPIIDAVNNTVYGLRGRLVSTSDGANCFLARQVYLTRFYAARQDEKSLDYMLKQLINIKLNIWQRLEDAQKEGTIKPHKQLELILKKFVFQPDTAASLVSTNWDTVVDEEVERMCNEEAERFYKITGRKYHSAMPAYHIHGSIKDENRLLSLYLPSEYSLERYRSKAESELHLRRTASVVQHVRYVDTIILYGLSLDPLDAELSQTIHGCLIDDHVKEIVIINLDHDIVPERVRILNPPNKPPIKITCIHPNDL